ncbi:hypothetical protein LXL04_039703 [Taraxacum kok-saghyz]
MQSFWKKKFLFSEIFFATELVFERFLAPEVGFWKKLMVWEFLGSRPNMRSQKTRHLGYQRDAPATVLFDEWFRFGKPSDQQFFSERTISRKLPLPPPPKKLTPRAEQRQQQDSQAAQTCNHIPKMPSVAIFPVNSKNDLGGYSKNTS